MTTGITISDYILQEYVPFKLQTPAIQVIYADEEHEASDDHAHAQERCTALKFPFARDNRLMHIPITKKIVLVQADEELDQKEVLELTFDISSENAENYQPGDTIGILPRNDEMLVNSMLCRLKLENVSHKKCCIALCSGGESKKSMNLLSHIPAETSPYELLRDCLDLNATPKKQFLRVLAGFCANAEEAAFLNCLSSKEAKHHYNSLILEQGLKLQDLLTLCPTCQPDLVTLIEHLPRLLPRPYSIANSPFTNAREMKIIFSLLNSKPGVTTNMLNKLASNIDGDLLSPMHSSPRVLAYFRESNKFRYTIENATANQILIGIGTGLAPFVGFMEHKYHIAREQLLDVPLGETWIFAGARTKAGILHRKRIQQLQRQLIFDKYFECISRDAEAEFHYLPEILQAKASEFISFLMQSSTVIYVCADGAKISKSIETAIKTTLINELKLEEENVNLMIKEFRSSGKYIEDVWC